MSDVKMSDIEIVMDAMEYRTNSLIENIKSEILHFANAHCSGDDINIYDVFKVIDDCCELSNSEIPNKSEMPTSSTTKNDLGVREFEEIVVEYPPKDLCTYPEYKGKPYFSIKYKEGNDYIIGYGTYNPQVLSRYLKDYFMLPTKNNLGVDCISRADVLKLMQDNWHNHNGDWAMQESMDDIRALPSVTPIRPKGHWIDKQRLFESCSAECSSCHKRSNGYLHDNGFSLVSKYFDFCPKCGSDNREVEDGECK